MGGAPRNPLTHGRFLFEALRHLGSEEIRGPLPPPPDSERRRGWKATGALRWLNDRGSMIWLNATRAGVHLARWS